MGASECWEPQKGLSSIKARSTEPGGNFNRSCKARKGEWARVWLLSAFLTTVSKTGHGSPPWEMSLLLTFFLCLASLSCVVWQAVPFLVLPEVTPLSDATVTPSTHLSW